MRINRFLGFLFIPLSLAITAFDGYSKGASARNFAYFPCPVKKDQGNGLWGYISKSGKEIIKPVYLDANPFREGLAKVVTNDERVEFIDITGRVVIRKGFYDAEDFHDGMARAYLDRSGVDNRLTGYINKRGFMVVQPKFIFADDFSEGVAFVCESSNKCGYINRKGKYIIKPIFADGRGFSEGLAMVRLHDRWGYIDKKGKFVIKPNFLKAWSFHEKAAVASLDGDKFGVVNMKGEFVSERKFNSACGKMEFSFSEGLLCAETDEVVGFWDKKGNLIIDMSGYHRIWDFQEGLAGVVVDEAATEIVYIDKRGKQAFSVHVDISGGWLGPFSKEGVAKVCSELGRMAYAGYGFIDRNGIFILEPKLSSDSY